MDKNSKIEKSYDELTYKSAAFAQSSPYKLEACATLLGINPPPCKNAKVLEIGCSFGGNLIPFAVNNENAKVVGIDLSGEQIRRGKEIVKEIGLSNLELIHGDICEFKSDEKFDYIIAHGVFSWVPDFVKDAILRVVRENLSQNGVAFISYNVYPGWKVKDILRDLILLAAEKKEGIRDKLQSAKEALLVFKKVLLNRDSEAFEKAIPAKSLISKIDNILENSDNYIAHEFLEEINDPFYFKDFCNKIDKFDLAYLCESDLNDIFAPDFGNNLVDDFKKKHFGDRIQSEQFFDTLNMRPFRQSLIVHKEAYELVKEKHIGPSDIAKINVAVNFKKVGDMWVSANQDKAMPHDISWLCEIFHKMYPASINLSQILEVLPEDKLNVYTAFVRVLSSIFDEAIVGTKEFLDIKYEPGKTRLKEALVPYMRYFSKNGVEKDIVFANELNFSESNFLQEDFEIILEFNGKNTEADIVNKVIKKIKAGKLNLVNEKDQKYLAVHAKEYVKKLSIILSIGFAFEEIE